MRRRARFSELFTIHSDGSLEPIRAMQVGGITFGPGVRFFKGVSFAGIDFTLFVGRDFDVEENGGLITIIGIYP